MEFSTAINQINTNFNLIGNYNKILQGQASFNVNQLSFEDTLNSAMKSIPLKDKQHSVGMGSFAQQIGDSVLNGLNSVNNAKLEADRLQEEMALGGDVDVHSVMIAAEKASLSMQMTMQVRNRLLSAYTDITSMPI